MRSTKASAAVERLKRRSENPGYSMVRTASGLFYLIMNTETGGVEKLNEPLELDAFVAFVNSLGPQTVKKVSKNDAAFESQLVRRASAKQEDTKA